MSIPINNSYRRTSASKDAFNAVSDGAMFGYSSKWWNDTKRMIDRGYARFAKKHNWKVSKNPQF